MLNIYAGWKNLLGSFLCAAIAVGFTTYVFGLFAIPVSDEFGISRATYNNGMIILMLGVAVSAPVVGQLLDRHSARRLLLIGSGLFGLSLIGISRVHSLWALALIIALPLTFSFSVCGMISANTVTVRWFCKRRGRALGILALSTSVGGFVAQPVTALLIESLGWRDALAAVGAAALIILLAMALWVVRDRPTGAEPGYPEEFHKGAADPAAGAARTAAHVGSERCWTRMELLRCRNFWLTASGIGLLFGIDQAVLVSQVPYFQDMGISLPTAALLVSVKTISAIIGKLAIGYFADRVDLRLLFTYVAGCNALLMTVYILQPATWALFLAVALLGVAVGGVFPVWTTMMAWLFGVQSYGTVMGLMSIITQPFAIITLRFVGQMYDSSGSYVPAFSVFVAGALVSIALIWLLKPQAEVQTGPPSGAA